MADGVIFVQWAHYQGSGEPALFAQQPLGFNSRQERLHQLGQGDHLWLVSRCPEDRQYYFVGVLPLTGQRRNPADSHLGQLFGEFGVLADPSQSHDLGTRFPAEGFLRALQFEPARPIKYGASLGQSLQSLRLLSDGDVRLLDAALGRVLGDKEETVDTPVALWTKCDRVFADYFLNNWQLRQEPLAFLLYDPPPALPPRSLVLVHSDKELRIVARFLAGQFVAGHKFTAEPEEREAERERVWLAHRAGTVSPPDKADFDRFWTGQNGVRGLFLMDSLIAVPVSMPFKVYGRALEWGYPTGFGYRYLSLSQAFLLLRLCRLPDEPAARFLDLLAHRAQ
jgi:hypothetical protein